MDRKHQIFQYRGYSSTELDAQKAHWAKQAEPKGNGFDAARKELDKAARRASNVAFPAKTGQAISMIRDLRLKGGSMGRRDRVQRTAEAPGFTGSRFIWNQCFLPQFLYSA